MSCRFEIAVVGKRENREKFYNALQGKGDICLGAGIWSLSHKDFSIEKKDASKFSGFCKWSVRTSLTKPWKNTKEKY